jgi:hypothetical protein
MTLNQPNLMRLDCTGRTMRVMRNTNLLFHIKGHTEGEADDDENEKNYKRAGPKSSDRDNGDEHRESVNPGK